MSGSVEQFVKGVTDNCLLKGEEGSWYSLISDGKFELAIKQIEKHLIEFPDSLETRLWWVRCHLDLAQLPPSALSAALEEIYPRLEESDVLSDLSCITFLLLGISLLSKSQSRLAVVMFERAHSFSMACEVFEEEQLALVSELYRDCLRSELRRAEEKREKLDYIDSLKDRLSALKTAPVKTSKAKSSVKSSRNVKAGSSFNSKSVLGMANDASESKAESDEVVNSKPAEKKSSLFAKLLLSSLFVILLTFSYWHFSKGPDYDLAMDFGSTPESPPLLPTTLVKVAPSFDQGFDKLKNRLKEISNRKSAEQHDASDLNSVENVSDVESKDNELHSGNLARTELEDLGGNAKVDRTKNKKNRVRRVRPGETLDGSQLKPYEVERFAEPVVYRTLTATNVMESPSVLSRTLIELEAGVKVHVVSKMGNWLELRSTRGNRGFIHAQDAVPE